MLFVGVLICSCSKFEDESGFDVFDTMPLTTNYPLDSDTYDTIIKLSASVGEGQPQATAMGFYISTDKELLGEDIDVEATEVVENKFSVWVEELTRDTRYYACAYTISESGKMLGNTISFTTSTETIPEIVYAGDAIVEKMNAIDISLFCNIDEEMGATREQIRRYGVRYWKSEESKETATTITIASGSSGFYYDTTKGLMIPITDILPNTEYDYEFFAYSTPDENVRSANDDDAVMQGAECLTPVVADFDAQYVGNSSIRVTATVVDTGNDPVLEYGFRLKSSTDEDYTIVQRVSPDYGEDDRATNDTDFNFYFDGLSQDEEYTIEVYAVNTILRQYGDGSTPEDQREEKSFTTTTVEESVWDLSDFSEFSYPLGDNWAILKGSKYAGVATEFDGLDAALAAIWEADPERRVKINLVDFETLPGSVFNFGADSTIETLEEITFSSAKALSPSAVQFCMGVKRVSAPYAETLAQQSICNNPRLEEISAPKITKIIGARALCNNPFLTRVNSDVDGELRFDLLTTNTWNDLMSNGVGSVCKITSVSMPLLEEVTQSGSTFGTNSIPLLTYLSLPSLEDGTNVFTSPNKVMVELDVPKMKIIPASAFDTNPVLTTLNAPALEVVGNNAFKSCTALSISTDVIKNLVNIGDYGFWKCAKITGDLDLPNTTIIGQFAFEECDGLTALDIPLVETINLATFRGCDALESVSMDSVVTFNKDILKNCKKIESVYMPNLKYVGETAFQFCVLLDELNLPELLETTGNGSFMNCTALTSVDMPKLRTIKGTTTFSTCSSLESVSLPSLESIGSNSTFINCSKLVDVEMPMLSKISGTSTFQGCTLLSEISLPALVSMGNSTFNGCAALKKANLPSATTFGTTFQNCKSLTHIYLDSVVTLGVGVLDAFVSLEYAYLPKLEVFTGAALLNSSRPATKDLTLEIATNSTISSFGTTDTALPALSGLFTLVSNGLTIDGDVWSVPYSGGTANYSGVTYVEDVDTANPSIAYDDVE